MTKKMRVFHVVCHDSDGDDCSQYDVAAPDDVVARAKAVKLFDRAMLEFANDYNHNELPRGDMPILPPALLFCEITLNSELDA